MEENKNAFWTFNRENVVVEQKERKVVIWGIGNLSAFLYSWAQERNISVYAFADRRKEDYANGYNGVDVISPDEVLKNKEEYYLWLCMDYYENMMEVLEDAGREEFRDYLYFSNIRRNSVIYKKYDMKEDILLDMFSDKEVLKGNDYKDGENEIIGRYNNVVLSGTGNVIRIGENVIIGEDTLIACKDGSKIIIEDDCELHGLIVACDGCTVHMGKNTKLNKDVRIECIENSNIALGQETRLRKKVRIFCADHSSVCLEDFCKLRKKTAISSTIHSQVCLKMGVEADEKTSFRVYKNANVRIGTACRIERKNRIIAKVGSRIEVGDFCNMAEQCILASDVDSSLEIGEHSFVGTNGVYTAKYNSTIQLAEKTGSQYGMLCNVGYGSSLKVGERTRFNRDTTIIAGNSHPIFDVTKPDEKYVCNDHIVLGADIWSGRGASFYSGAEVGDGCVIGVYTMVKRKYPNNCMLMGNPARVIRRDIIRGFGESPDSVDSIDMTHHWKKTEGEEKKDGHN